MARNKEKVPKISPIRRGMPPAEYLRLWRAANPEKTKEHAQRNRAAHRTTHLKWQKDNPEKCVANAIRWNKANPGKVSLYRARRRAAMVGDPDSLNAFYLHVKNVKKIRCYWCKKSVKPSDRHVDHVIPLARGGAHAVGNLCCSCAHCNLSKNSKPPELFSGQGELSLA